jgi:threonine dehydrogenase-like Zn-dependent dehydrogenase
MKALCWHGTKNVSVDTVPDPAIQDQRDIIVQITTAAICGSDLHLYHGVVPKLEDGDILGHEFMGIVVEKGKDVKNLEIGDKVVVPFTISCGSCFFCEKQLYSSCDVSNTTRETAETLFGHSPAGLFGYTHIFGGYSGGQAQYVRVPYGDVGGFKVPHEISDEKVLFLGDILSTAWMAVKNAGIEKGETVAIWGAGPVGLLTAQCAWLQGAGRVVVIDDSPGRLLHAENKGKAEVINFAREDVNDRLKELTSGRGPDACIDAVGMEAHGTDILSKFEGLKQNIGMTKDVPVVLRQAIMACRKGGTISIPGVYAAYVNHLPLGAAFNKGLTFKMGQTHVQAFLPELYEYIDKGALDPSCIISHRLTLHEIPRGYEIFDTNREECTKVIIKIH